MVELENNDEDQIKDMPMDLEKLDRTVRIRTCLKPETREKLNDFMKQRIHCFAWNSSNMLGIDPKIITHKLNVDLTFKLIK